MIAAALLLAMATAQVRPQPGAGDPRIQSVEYKVDQIVELRVGTGYQLGVEFAADEHIQNIAVGDSGAWQVTATRSGDRLFIKPAQGVTSTNLTVVTNVRVYLFDLVPMFGPAPDMAYTVRFRYPQTKLDEATPLATSNAVYEISGARELRPSGMSDDGEHTFIEWPTNASLPAVYAIDARGRETLVNGMMRDGLYVIDGISPRMAFRIDSRTARAVRTVPRQPR